MDLRKKLLEAASTIAVVGASAQPWRDSYHITEFLIARGYDVYPVNPNYTEVLGRKCVPSLAEVPVHINIVDVFRRPEAVPAIVEEAYAVGADAIWLQLGAENPQAEKRAHELGLDVVSHACIAVAHSSLRIASKGASG